MQNPIQKLRQSSIVFQKPGILSGKLKTLTSFNYGRGKYFLLKLSTRFLLFYFLIGFSTHSMPFLITQDLKKIKINPEQPFVGIVKSVTCGKFQQIILNSMVVWARQSFQVFRQIIWFHWNNRALSKFRNQILRYLISIIKSWKLVCKIQFHINHANHLNPL